MSLAIALLRAALFFALLLVVGLGSLLAGSLLRSFVDGLWVTWR